ncbi:MAG: tetratricopeptide repeat protein [Candidatus Aminicenantes bacterium]|nr:tetratricopeptide repeat protein [Candidatus Aminicenantes bacterium]
MKTKKTVLIVLSILLVAGTLSAQGWKGKGRFNGVVKDEAGVPIEGVSVKLFHVGEKGGFEVKTDKDGKYTAAWLRFGAWNVDFYKVGYELKQIQVQIQELGKNPDIEMVLKKAEGLMLTDDLKKDLEAANALFEKEDYTGAIAAFEAMLVKNPDVYILYKNIGNCYFSMEQYDKAEEAYLKILEKESGNIDAIMGVANSYANRNENEKAMEWYNKIDMAKITDSTVLVNIGINYMKAGQTEMALKFFQQAVAVNPKDLDALYRLGVQYIATNNKAEAIACFENFLKIAPSDEERVPQVQGFLEYLKK